MSDIPDTAAQIAFQKRLKEICEQDNERLTAVVRGYEKQIAKLEQENEILKRPTFSRRELEEQIVELQAENRALRQRPADEMREMLRAMQAGEMTVSRGVELIEMWLAGNYSDEQLPPVSNSLGDDVTPLEQIAKLSQLYELAVDQYNEQQEQIAQLQAAFADRVRVIEMQLDDKRKLQAENADLKRLTQYPNNCEYVKDTIIAQLQAENAELRQANSVTVYSNDPKLEAAARMAYDVLGLIKLNTPPSKLVDECLVKLRDALGERHE